MVLNMEFKACEECTEIKVTELKGGNYHLELFLKEDSVLKKILEGNSKYEEKMPDDVIDKLKEVWCGNIITFHT